MPWTKNKTRAVTAMLAGAIYGLLLRLGFEASDRFPFLEIVSLAFLVVCPFSVGAIAVIWKAGRERISFKDQLIVSALAILLFLMATFVTLLEGMICIVLMAPVFIIASVIGGVMAGFVHNRWRAKPQSLMAFALLPFLVVPFEGRMPQAHDEQSVTNSIIVNASPEQVFAVLGTVQNIQPDELGFSFLHLIGLPKPIEAQMSGSGKGSVRTSRWEKDVWFQEQITSWQAPREMKWNFIIPPGAIPREALDRHVEVGGEYFDLVSGGYTLQPLANGQTELSLTTRFANKSSLQLYGNLWGKMVLADFHESILGLMKQRAERGQS